MITKAYLTEKIKEICIWKGQNFPTASLEVIFPSFENASKMDLDSAVKELIDSEERFSPGRLKWLTNRWSMSRRETDWGNTKDQEKEQAKTFWQNQGNETCNRTACRGCPKIEYCKIRGREWLKGIKLILEGRTTDEKVNNYMWYEFMGGIK